MIGSLLFFAGLYSACIGVGVAMIFEVPAGMVARWDRWRFNAPERRAARRARRRRRAERRAAIAAGRALQASQSQWDRAYRAERRAFVELAFLAVVVVGLVAALIVAGCGGCYPLEPSPDAGADAGSPPCTAPAGYVILAHSCDCASAPALDECATETSDGHDHQQLSGCVQQNGETCTAACPVCP